MGSGCFYQGIKQSFSILPIEQMNNVITLQKQSNLSHPIQNNQEKDDDIDEIDGQFDELDLLQRELFYHKKEQFLDKFGISRDLNSINLSNGPVQTSFYSQSSSKERPKSILKSTELQTSRRKQKKIGRQCLQKNKSVSFNLVQDHKKYFTID